MVSRVVWGIISKALKESSTLSVTIKMVHSIGVGGFNCSWHITVGLLMDHNVIKCNWPPITTTQFIYLLVKLAWFETTKDHLALWPPSPAIQFAWFETTMDHLTQWPPSTMTHFVWFEDTMDHLAEWQSSITGKTLGRILSDWYVSFLFTILYFEAKSVKFKSIISGTVQTFFSRVA